MSRSLKSNHPHRKALTVAKPQYPTKANAQSEGFWVVFCDTLKRNPKIRHMVKEAMAEPKEEPKIDRTQR